MRSLTSSFLERDLRECERASESNVRLANSHTHSLHLRNGERSLADTLDQFLQIMNVPVGNDCGDQIIQLTIIDYACGALCAGRSRNPYRKVHLDRLRDLSFVWQHANARMKRHRLERHLVECCH